MQLIWMKNTAKYLLTGTYVLENPDSMVQTKATKPQTKILQNCALIRKPKSPFGLKNTPILEMEYIPGLTRTTIITQIHTATQVHIQQPHILQVRIPYNDTTFLHIYSFLSPKTRGIFMLLESSPVI